MDEMNYDELNEIKNKINDAAYRIERLLNQIDLILHDFTYTEIIHILGIIDKYISAMSMKADYLRMMEKVNFDFAEKMISTLTEEILL
jgi:hypothetical protein